MQRTPFELNYHLQTLTPLRLAALPPGPAWGQAQLAGSLIKGAARRSAVDIAALLNMRPCQADADPQCALCRLFGAPGLEAVLHWSPASVRANTPASELGWQARQRRPVDRSTGVSTRAPAPARVAIAAGVLFDGSLHGWLAGDAMRDAGFVVAALQRLVYVGGGGASGYGRVGVTVGSVRLAGEPHEPDALLAPLVAQEAV